ncbi:MAG: hypothetical protein AABX31_02610 [Nanoarchaeota archaeon]
MKSLFFDTGPIITLVMSRLIWILPELKKKYGGKFYITPSVKRELITRPMDIKRFQFEALQALKLIKDGVLEVYEDIPQKEVLRLHAIANSSFRIGNQNMEVVQSGEIESVVCALKAGAEAMVMDERTMRLFIENNQEMKALLERRFNQQVSVDVAKAKQFSKELGGIQIIRSVELVGVAYKMGLLDSYIPSLKNGREVLVEAALWNAKFNGAAVTEHEVEEIKEYLLRK